jgi:hypothetical protein
VGLAEHLLHGQKWCIGPLARCVHLAVVIYLGETTEMRYEIGKINERERSYGMDSGSETIELCLLATLVLCFASTALADSISEAYRPYACLPGSYNHHIRDSSGKG